MPAACPQHSPRCGRQDRSATLERGESPAAPNRCAVGGPIPPVRDVGETSTYQVVLPRHSVEVRDVCRRLLWQTSGHAHQGDHQHPSAPASNKCHDQPPSRNHSCPHFPWSRKRQALLPRPGYADFRRLLTDPMAAGLFFSRSVGRRNIPIF